MVTAAEETSSERRLSRGARIALGVIVVVLLLLAVAVAYGAWDFSSQIADGALRIEHDPVTHDVAVVAVNDEAVTLRLTDEDRADLLSDEILGIRWPDGYAQLGPVAAATADTVTRPYTMLTGSPLRDVGFVDLDGFAFPHDDPGVLGLDRVDVTYESPLGEFDAWFFPGSRDTWVVFTHGRGVDRGEALRILPLVVDAGYPSLVITYRNDAGQPATDDRHARFGATEWRDLEAAVRLALDEGAEGVVLYGYSMGGAISVSFMYESDLAPAVRGLVLDAPALNFEAIVDERAGQTNLPLVPVRVPEFLTELAKIVAERRYDFDFEEVDYVARADEMPDVPVLLIHGDGDDTVPVSVSDDFALRRTDIVTYERFVDAGHVRAWNVDRPRYEAAVAEFLAALS